MLRSGPVEEKRWEFGARDTSGAVIYCKRFSYSELERQGFRVLIERGVMDC